MADWDDNLKNEKDAPSNTAEGATASAAQRDRASKPRPSVKDKQRKRDARRQRGANARSIESEGRRDGSDEPVHRSAASQRSHAFTSGNATSNAETPLRQSVSDETVPSHPEFRVIHAGAPVRDGASGIASEGDESKPKDFEGIDSPTIGLANEAEEDGAHSEAPVAARFEGAAAEEEPIEGESDAEGSSDKSPRGSVSMTCGAFAEGGNASETNASEGNEIADEDVLAEEMASTKDDEIARQKRRSAKRRAARQEAAAQRELKKRHRLITIATVALVAITIALLVSWQRWWQYDDAVDIQGQWVSTQNAGDVVVSIDQDVIHLRDDVGYAYELDTTAKTITYTFGTMEGQGRYWFSTDRNTLVIVDGQGYTALSTLGEDIVLWWNNLFAALRGEQTTGPAGLSSVSFVRQDGVPAAVSSEPQQATNSGSPANVGSIVDVPPTEDGDFAGGDNGNAGDESMPGVPDSPMDSSYAVDVVEGTMADAPGERAESGDDAENGS